MKRLLVAVMLVAFAAAVAVAAEGPATVTLEAKMGNVTFDHHAHQAKVADCTTCHHKGTDNAKCTGCHNGEGEAPKAKDAFHKLCKDCHKKEAGPTGCKDCHKK